MMEFKVGMNRSLVAQGYGLVEMRASYWGFFFEFNMYFPGKPGEAGTFSGCDWNYLYPEAKCIIILCTEYISLRIKIVGCNVASQVDHDDDIYGERGERRTALLEDHEM